MILTWIIVLSHEDFKHTHKNIPGLILFSIKQWGKKRLNMSVFGWKRYLSSCDIKDYKLPLS